MRVLFLANYPRDAQESMLRFATLLAEGLHSRGVVVDRVAPRSLCGRLTHQTVHEAGKWLGYIDKYALFPIKLVVASRPQRPDLIHVADHSNALYVPLLRRRFPRVPVLVTCHDLLAVRYALEGIDPDYRVGATGRMLQKAILRGLKRATHVACDSGATWQDVRRLVLTEETPSANVIPVGLAHPYRVMSRSEADERLGESRALLDQFPAFLLHVGSSQPRKNRPFLIRLLGHIAAEWQGAFVFAGSPLTGEQRALAGEMGVSDRIVEIPGPDNEVLNALYARAEAFLFPSRAEGFGWPIIEAQASGCPVLASNIDPHPEVAGEGGALLLPLEDLAAWAAALREIWNPASISRSSLTRAGLENTLRHRPESMISEYYTLYGSLAA